VHVIRFDIELDHAEALAMRLRDALAKLRDELALSHRRKTVDETERHVLGMVRRHRFARIVGDAFAAAPPPRPGAPPAMPHRAASLVESQLNMTLSFMLLRHD
jgi:hypothetical protein